MWICKRILFAPPFARVCFIRRDHTAVTNGGRGLGNLNEEVNQRFRKRTLERLHRWDGMSGNDWFMIYRDNYASRFILLVTMAVPVIGFLTSENCMADVKDGRLWDAFKDTNIVRQMGILVVLPMFSFLLVTYLAWRLNAIRIHRIYVSKKDQKTFTAIISHCGIFTRKLLQSDVTAAVTILFIVPFIAALTFSQILFTKHNVRILESAGHQLWSFVKGSIKINKHRFMLNDESFRDIQCRHLMLGRSIKLPFSADKSKKTTL